jgi:D-3-phosphoglycerate dehydrogenase / 2-oxoglutarate reductase
MPGKVLVTDHIFENLDAERSILEPFDLEVVLAEDATEAALVEQAADATALMVCFAKVPEAVVAAAAQSGCKIIARYGIGYDNIDVAAATENDLLVTYVPDYCLDEVADHAVALLLSLARGIFPAAPEVREGSWKVPHGAVHRLRGRRLAVIGVGGIGARVIDRARAFGLEPVGFDPYVENWSVPAERADSLEAAIDDADLITLHVPLTAENRHMIGRQSISRMQRSPIVVNTARGGLVDSDAAAEGLESGRLGGLALDVMETEPPASDHPLRRHPRAVLTPHMAFYSIEAQAELQRRAAEEVARALKGEPPDRPINPEVLDRR